MTSQISTHKLLKHELRQNGWMFGLTALLHFLTGPVIFLLGTSTYSRFAEDKIALRFSTFFTNTFFIWQLITIILCISISIFTYRYLFSRRMVDLYHSVPITRQQLFWVKYLHGFLIWFVPFLLNVISVGLLTMLRLLGNPYMLSALWPLAKCSILLLLCFFIFYHLFLTAVYISGNVLNMFTNVAIMGCTIVALWYICYAHAATFWDTFCMEPSLYLLDVLFSLSPFTSPFAIYGYYISGQFASGHILLLVLSAAVSLGMLFLAKYLCRIRPSELAERGTLLKAYTIPARILASILVGIAGSIFFSEISSSEYDLAWGIFGALLCSILAYGALNSIFRATIKAFFRHKPQILLSAAVSTLVIVSFQLDLFGYDTYLPDKNDIAGIAVYTSRLTDDSTYRKLTENGQIVYEYDNNHVIQKELLTDQDACYHYLDTIVNGEPEGTYTTFYTKIKLENGYTYTRRYRLYSNQFETVKPFIESDAYKETNYKYSIGTFGYPDTLKVNLWNGRFTFEVTQNTIRRLMDAYQADFEEHYNLDELGSYMRVASLSGRYVYADDSNYFGLDVPDNYTRTLAILQELQPEYFPPVSSAEDIQEIYIYSDVYEQSYGLADVYQYFGYQVKTTDTESADGLTESANTAEKADGTENAESSEIVEIADAESSFIGEADGPTAIIVAETVPASTEIYPYSFSMELTITDSDLIEQLYPLLTFGSYTDMLDKNEYIYIGHITTRHGEFTQDCYIKPGTMPEEIIQLLYDTRVIY